MSRLQGFFVLLFVVFLSVATAHAITYQEGVRAAKDQNKPLYLYFYNDG
jgi:hypothetical protein